MRLLFVIDSLGSGGAQRQVVTLAEGLSHRGHSIEFFTYLSRDFFRTRLEKAGILIHDHRKRSRFSPDVIFALRNIFRRRAYDLVLSFLEVPNFYCELARCG